MNIAYCSMAKLPSREANSVQIMKMCQAFAKHNKVVLYAPDYSNLEKKDLYNYYNVNKSFEIKKIKWDTLFLHAIQYAKRVVKDAKKNGADVIFTRDISCAFFAVINRIDVYWESHMPIEYSRKWYQLFFEMIKNNCRLKKIVVISSTLKKYYTSRGVNPEKILVAADGADLPDKTGVAHVEEIRSEYLFNVGYIGQLYPGKGMEIISELVVKCPNIGFHIIGGMEKDIEIWKQKLEGHNNVLFYGYKEQKQIANYAFQMDAFIAPYLRNVSGVGNDKRSDIGNWMSPLKLFEYMSYKKPIICSNLEVLEDVMKNMENGILCNPDNIEEWMRAISYLQQNPDDAQRIANNGYDQLVNQFTWDKRVEFILR